MDMDAFVAEGGLEEDDPYRWFFERFSGIAVRWYAQILSVPLKFSRNSNVQLFLFKRVRQKS